ncbi:precorrin-8X methylmutase [Zongyangia hominis]|uniref:Precorrin-8X methylmutase n=1 Tax=Zongyangia hominis TaxID=2763677 RepID=A0A926EC93_9FIRM|nr:precorrin-8X methylmutase [Zongyangia hominis]MBC8569306.1 precorrin-8X methylmutase [Zongyangia hominis]
MKIELEKVLPQDIERRSMEIIARELGDRRLEEENADVIKRVIHTTADFDYAENLIFSPGAVERGRAALRAGCHIVTDTQMAKAGINKGRLARLGGEVHCFMSDEDVAKSAKEHGTTRAAASMDKALSLPGPIIYAIGNAPTALVSLYEQMEEGLVRPALVIGVPVGFVNVIPAKELMLGASVPYIVARGRKGGSNVAAAICNALLYGIGER